MRPLLRALSGFILWAAGFAALYGLQGLVCAPQLAGTVGKMPLAGRELLMALWLAFLALSGWWTHRLWQSRSRESLLDWLAPILAVTGTLATIATGFPVLFANMCG